MLEGDASCHDVGRDAAGDLVFTNEAFLRWYTLTRSDAGSCCRALCHRDAVSGEVESGMWSLPMCAGMMAARHSLQSKVPGLVKDGVVGEDLLQTVDVKVAFLTLQQRSSRSFAPHRTADEAVTACAASQIVAGESADFRRWTVRVARVARTVRRFREDIAHT